MNDPLDEQSMTRIRIAWNPSPFLFLKISASSNCFKKFKGHIIQKLSSSDLFLEGHAILSFWLCDELVL